MDTTVMEATDVCKSFASDGVQNHVLNGVSLHVCTGDFVAVMRSSGSGALTRHVVHLSCDPKCEERTCLFG